MWGFTNSSDRSRMESFLRKATKAQFYKADMLSLAELCDFRDHRLFNSIVDDKDHVLHKLLPPKVTHGKELRKRRHDYTLPTKSTKLDGENFLIRMLFTDTY